MWLGIYLRFPLLPFLDYEIFFLKFFQLEYTTVSDLFLYAEFVSIYFTSFISYESFSGFHFFKFFDNFIHI